MFNYTVLTSFVSPPTSAKPISKPTFNLNLWNFSSGINIYGQYTAKASAMDGRISSHRTMLLYLFFGILATPFTHRHSIIVCVGGGYGVRSEKWNGQHIAKHLIFYFPPIRYTIFIFVWFQGCVRFNKLDELSQQQQHGDDGWKKKHNATHTNGPRKNNFISLHSCSLHTYMFAGSGIWTSDSHKYTKNVCMTGHNIKYHQNRRRTKWKSCMMGVGFPTPFYCPTPGSLAHSLASYVCPFSHPSTLYFSTSSNRNFLEKEFHVRQKGKFVELKLVSGSGRW